MSDFLCLPMYLQLDSLSFLSGNDLRINVQRSCRRLASFVDLYSRELPRFRVDVFQLMPRDGSRKNPNTPELVVAPDFNWDLFDETNPLVQQLFRDYSTSIHAYGSFPVFVPHNFDSFNLIACKERNGNGRLLEVHNIPNHPQDAHALARVVSLVELLSSGVYFLQLRGRHFFNPCYIHFLNEFAAANEGFVSARRQLCPAAEWPLRPYVAECELHEWSDMNSHFEELCGGLASGPVAATMPLMVGQILSSGLSYSTAVAELLIGRSFCQTLYLPNLHYVPIEFFNELVEFAESSPDAHQLVRSMLIKGRWHEVPAMGGAVRLQSDEDIYPRVRYRLTNKIAVANKPAIRKNGYGDASKNENHQLPSILPPLTFFIELLVDTYGMTSFEMNREGE